MTDVVCAGPVFLDLTFEGLESLPVTGEEHFATDLHATPGGAGITAIGLARLGLEAAVVAPLGPDFAGVLVREWLEEEGVVCAGQAIHGRCVTRTSDADDVDLYGRSILAPSGAEPG